MSQRLTIGWNGDIYKPCLINLVFLAFGLNESWYAFKQYLMFFYVTGRYLVMLSLIGEFVREIPFLPTFILYVLKV